jgi:hypothetical protein
VNLEEVIQPLERLLSSRRGCLNRAGHAALLRLVLCCQGALLTRLALPAFTN